MEKIKENTTKQNIQLLVEQFMRISNKINDMHGDAMKLSDGTALALGEIHLIECIGKHPESNVTELAEILGNTKGAVSQMAKKLEKKGLICKEKRGKNQKEIFLTLTEHGRDAFLSHEKLHEGLYEDIAKAMDSLKEEKFRELREIFDIIELHIDRY